MTVLKRGGQAMPNNKHRACYRLGQYQLMVDYWVCDREGLGGWGGGNELDACTLTRTRKG